MAKAGTVSKSYRSNAKTKADSWKACIIEGSKVVQILNI